MEPSSVPEGEECVLPKLGLQPSLSAWLGAMVGTEPTFCVHPGVSSLQCLGACPHPLNTPMVTCPPVWHLLDAALALCRKVPPQDPLFAGLPSSSQAALFIKDGPNSCSVGLPIFMPERKAPHLLLLLLLVLLLHIPVAKGLSWWWGHCCSRGGSWLAATSQFQANRGCLLPGFVQLPGEMCPIPLLPPPWARRDGPRALWCDPRWVSFLPPRLHGFSTLS